MTERKSRRRSVGGGGTTIPTLLLIIFIILKLTKVIDWSWLWVLSPLWISASIAVLIFLVIGFILFAALIGIASQSSRIVVGIKSLFGKTVSEESLDESYDEG